MKSGTLKINPNVTGLLKEYKEKTGISIKAAVEFAALQMLKDWQKKTGIQLKGAK